MKQEIYSNYVLYFKKAISLRVDCTGIFRPNLHANLEAAHLKRMNTVLKLPENWGSLHMLTTPFPLS